MMNIKQLLVAGACLIMVACQNQQNDTQTSTDEVSGQVNFPDSLSSRRVSFAMNLKKMVAERSWTSFGEKSTEGTLIYFNGDKSEVFFPSARVREALNDPIEYSNDYWLVARMDSIPYHMEVMISFDEADSSEFFYRHPVEQYSSVEEIGRYIPSVESTEMWAMMVVHEMFHHYQYNNENYRKYAESVIGVLPFNIQHLVAICQEDADFLAMIQKENDCLMQAISEVDRGIRDSLISEYLSKRENRIQKYSTEYPNLEQVENYYVIQEGSARYIEYQSIFVLAAYAKESSPPVVAADPKFQSYSEFEEIDLESPAFNYLIYAAATDYHYTIGFNIMRLLDQLQVEYKPYLLNNPAKGLHQYLEEYVEGLPNK